jgi:hypothetical protein
VLPTSTRGGGENVTSSFHPRGRWRLDAEKSEKGIISVYLTLLKVKIIVLSLEAIFLGDTLSSS